MILSGLNEVVARFGKVLNGLTTPYVKIEDGE
jgi:hypothetical protein